MAGGRGTAALAEGHGASDLTAVGPGAVDLTAAGHTAAVYPAEVCLAADSLAVGPLWEGGKTAMATAAAPAGVPIHCRE